MVLQSYNLDRIAQKLALKYRDKEVVNQSHKMRLTATYGLQRFWGEHFRLLGNSKTRYEGEYWRETWNELVKIMERSGVAVPNDSVNSENTDELRKMTQKLWDDEQFPGEDRQYTLAVLIQLCDRLVWWTQRYKKKSERDRKEQKGEF